MRPVITANRRRVLLCCLLLCGAAVPQARAQQTPADSAWDAGDMTTAERLFRERLAADSNDQRALQRMALLLAWGEHYDESLRLYDRLLRLAPENFGARIERARVVAWSGDPAKAAEELEPVIAEAVLQAQGGRLTVSATDGDETLIVIDLPAP